MVDEKTYDEKEIQAYLKEQLPHCFMRMDG